MDYAELVSRIKKGEYKPVYLLMGEEPYYLDLLTRLFQEVIIPEEIRDFNLVVTDGDKVTEKDVVDACISVPMMGGQKVVIVKEAQNLWKNKKAKGENDKAPAGILANYVAKPNTNTVLVLCYRGNLDRRKKIYAEIAKQGVVFESKKLQDYKVPEWIRDYAKSQSLKIDDKAISMLFESVGNDLSRLVHEMEKLKLHNQDGSLQITEDIVERYIGVSKEYNNFELQHAIEEHDTLKAAMIADNLAKNPKMDNLFPAISMLYGFFFRLLIYHYSDNRNDDYAMTSRMKLTRAFVLRGYRNAAKWYSARKCIENIHLLRTANANAVGLDSRADSPEVFRELVFKLMH